MMIYRLKKIYRLLFLLSITSFLPISAQQQTPSLNIPAIPPKVQGEPQRTETNLFLNVLGQRLAKANLTVEKFCPQDNIVARRILKDYGAVFVGNGEYSAPCFFKDEATVQAVQNNIGFSPQVIDGVRIELQSVAMAALLKAVEEARTQGLRITPRGGAIAARRSFSATVTLWNSRIFPGLIYWVNKGRISAAQAQAIRGMDTFNQIVEILKLEEQGIYFSKDFSKSILYSVAAPGTSQHNLMLALDVEQFSNPRVRQVLANNGWFQTVASDLPHFTYLGVAEKDLPSLGLHSVNVGSQIFWIPQIETAP